MLLLDPSKNIYLVKTLYGILMILPQGKAFTALNKRLKNIELLMLMDSKANILNVVENDKIDFYLKEFERVQLIKKS